MHIMGRKLSYYEAEKLWDKARDKKKISEVLLNSENEFYAEWMLIKSKGFKAHCCCCNRPLNPVPVYTAGGDGPYLYDEMDYVCEDCEPINDF